MPMMPTPFGAAIDEINEAWLRTDAASTVVANFAPSRHQRHHSGKQGGGSDELSIIR